MCLLPAMNSLAATIPELSFATQIVHVNMDSKDQSKLYEPIKELDIMLTQVRADISKLSFLRIVLKPLLNLILTVKTSCFSPYILVLIMEIFRMFGELSMNYKLTGEARGYFHRDLKSENMFSKNVIIKITDLGVAWEVHSNIQSMSRHAGTWHQTYRLQSYVYTSKVDMWAMGAILTKVCDRYPNQRDMVEGAKSY
ncbi:unnamed protein product [Brassica napus]|uniref:(rape) hypothetical protein n=1 Tax=Brassica napus TaxID=3708 RepID=A0A816X9Y8_BRANA|nr:unnamed protein product [Brassica napus]